MLAWLCVYHSFVWSNLDSLHISKWIILPSYVYSYTRSVLICCIHLLCDWWFRPYHHLAYICYFVASYLFTLVIWLVLIAFTPFKFIARTLQNILADLDNTVVWIVSIRLPISNTFSPLTNLLGTVPNAPITIGISITLMFYSLVTSLTSSKYLSHFFVTLLSAKSEVQYSASSLFFFLSVFFFFFFFLLIITRSDQVIRLYFKLTQYFGIHVCAYTIR